MTITDQGGDRDDGSGEASETPDLLEKLEGRQRPRGWGLFLIEKMVDDMQVETEGRRHTVRLTVQARRPGTDEEGEGDDDQHVVRSRSARVSGTAVLVVRGDIDREAESNVSSAYEQGVATDPRRVILDFAATEYINSSGIALIVSVLARARADGSRWRRRPFGSLPGDLRDHPPVRLHRALPRPRRGSRTRRPGTW